MPRWANSAELRELVEPRWGAPRSWRCVYCGRTTGQDVQIDHFTPRERGGLDLPWNLVPACPGCNASKKDHDPIAWMREVGVHPATALALEQIAQKPRWKYKPGDFLFRASSLQYRRVEGEALNTGPSWLQNVPPTLVLPRNLSEVFVLDSDAWSPTVALRRVAGSYLTDLGYPAISSQQLNRDLEARRLRRTTRDGRPGYRGFYTIPGAAADFTPSHADLAASRYRRKLISDNRF